MSGSVEDEAGISPKATLEPSNGIAWNLETKNTSIAISSKTAIRPNTRCLIVGRQAKSADIRIQHKSISRRHAALYFLGDDCILENFGSKTFVNGQPVEGRFKLKTDDVIVFGKVRETPFKVSCKEDETDEQREDSKQSIDFNTLPTEKVDDNPAVEIENSEVNIDPSLTGRARREAEIAAMMQSLDQTPTYQKFIPKGEDSATPKLSQNNGNGIHKSPSKHEIAEIEALDRISMVAQQHKVPIRERMSLSHETERRHCVTSFAIDPSGVRFIVGTTDNTLRLYDFGGMDRLRRDPFKILQSDEGHIVADLCYSNTGDRILVGTSSVQPYVLDRDGGEIMKFVRGDMYVIDQAKTSGHTAAVTGVAWHPLERDVVLTSSNDGSARLWNLKGKTQFQMLVCDKVFQPKSFKGQRTTVTCVAYHPAGREFAVGTSCGSVQIWNTARVSSRPDRAVYDVHNGKNAVSTVVYSFDGTRLATRSVDDSTCKVWDARRLSRSASPIAMCSNVPTLFEHCKPAFNPEGTILCVGTSQLATSKEGKRIEVGRVKFFHVPIRVQPSNDIFEPVLELEISFSAGVTLVHWHPKLNQIFLGCSDGIVEILFDPYTLSKKGACLPFAKAGQKSDGLTELLRSRAPTGSAGVRGQIIAPNALQIGQGTKRKRSMEEEDPSKSRQPEAPAAGFKMGTQSGAAVNFTQFVVDSRLGATKTIAGKDPREELLKYNEGKSYISQAYKGNVETILTETTVEQEEHEQK